MLVRAVGQKHNKVARLRMAPDPKTDPEREVAELTKAVAKKSKKRADDDESGGRREGAGVREGESQSLGLMKTGNRMIWARKTMMTIEDRER